MAKKKRKPEPFIVPVSTVEKPVFVWVLFTDWQTNGDWKIDVWGTSPSNRDAVRRIRQRISKYELAGWEVIHFDRNQGWTEMQDADGETRTIYSEKHEVY